MPGETVQFINNPAVNDAGGYAVSVNTTGSGTTLSRAFGNATGGAGAVILSEATYGDLQQTSWESFIGLSDAGEIAYSPSVTDLGSGTTGIDSVWLDATPILAEGDPIAQLAGQFSAFNSRPGLTGDTSRAIGVDEFVFFDGAIALREGDVLALGPTMVTIAGAIEGAAMNEDGDWAVTWDVDTTTGNLEALIVNGALELVEGDAMDWNGDGVIDAGDDGAVLTDFTGIGAVRVGRRDAGTARVYFTADVELNGGAVLEGFFCYPVATGPACPEDLSGNGQVDFADILLVIAAWGACPS